MKTHTDEIVRTKARIKTLERLLDDVQAAIEEDRAYLRELVKDANRWMGWHK